MSASTIYLIISGLPVIYYIYLFFINKRLKSVSWDIDKGNRCYSCKEKLQNDLSVNIDRLLNLEKYHTLCLSCKREIKILQLTNPVYRLKIKFKKFLLSENYKKVSIILLFAAPALVLLEVLIFVLLKSDFNFKLYPFVNLIYCFLHHQKTRYVSIKKPSE